MMFSNDVIKWMSLDISRLHEPMPLMNTLTHSSFSGFIIGMVMYFLNYWNMFYWILILELIYICREKAQVSSCSRVLLRRTSRIVVRDIVLFLDASSHLYMRPCPSVLPLVGWLVKGQWKMDFFQLRVGQKLDILYIILYPAVTVDLHLSRPLGIRYLLTSYDLF